MPTFPPLVTFAILTGGLVLMALGAFLLGLDDPAGLVLFLVGTLDVALAAFSFVRSQNPPTT